ncbi:MAG: glucose-6-phosphate isomerase [Lysinibacillus sp.]
MSTLSFDTSFITKYATLAEMKNYDSIVKLIHTNIHSTNSIDKNSLGWLDYGNQMSNEELNSIEEIAKEIQHNADILIVIGVGGSYLGAKAIEDALGNYFPQKSKTEIIYAGNNLSGTYIKQLLHHIHDKSVYINFISKSGSTTEPAISFRILRTFMEEKYGSEAAKRIIATTDAHKGILKDLADQQGYRQFIIPENIGGRYSVLTPVGLLPAAVAGISIRSLLFGANKAMVDFQQEDLKKNTAYQYAVIRHLLYTKGYTVELFTSFEPNLKYFQEWWKQLFGESEGKEHKGIFPADVTYPTDLHSFGQYVQDGHRQLFETMLSFKEAQEDIVVPFVVGDIDQLNYIAQRSLYDINEVAKNGTILAHAAGDVPIIEIQLEALDAYHIGYALYFFMKACAMSAYLLDVNPFDQPGVEAYKINMFRLLEKPGYSQEPVISKK